MKLYQDDQPGPALEPTFTDEEINVLRREALKVYRADHQQLANHARFLMEYLQDQISWTTMTSGQRRYLWAIKYIAKGMVG
jgi:hypothetical protein